MRSPSKDSCTPGQADYGHWEHRTSSVSRRSNERQPRCLDPDVPSEIDLDLGKRRMDCYLERRNCVQQGDTELSAAQPRVSGAWRSTVQELLIKASQRSKRGHRTDSARIKQTSSDSGWQGFSFCHFCHFTVILLYDTNNRVESPLKVSRTQIFTRKIISVICVILS